MIVLPKDFGSFLFVRDGIVLEGSFAFQILWNLKDAPSARFQYTIQFLHGLGIIRDVLQNMVAEDYIELVILKRKIAYICLYVRER